MSEARIKLLQDIPIFGGIRSDILGFLLNRVPVVSLEKDDYFFHENDKGTSMFVLETGRVAVLKHWRGNDYLLKHLDKGDCFGEMSLIDLFPRSASVRAAEHCQAIELSSEDLWELYQQDLDQFTLIYMNVGREISRRLRETDQRLFDLAASVGSIGRDYLFHSGLSRC